MASMGATRKRNEAGKGWAGILGRLAVEEIGLGYQQVEVFWHALDLLSE